MCYREYEDAKCHRARHNQQYRQGLKDTEYDGPSHTPPRLTGTIDALIDIFFDGVFYYGDTALPAKIEERDEPDTDDEFFHKYLNAPSESQIIQYRFQDADFNRAD